MILGTRHSHLQSLPSPRSWAVLSICSDLTCASLAGSAMLVAAVVLTWELECNPLLAQRLKHTSPQWAFSLGKLVFSASCF